MAEGWWGRPPGADPQAFAVQLGDVDPKTIVAWAVDCVEHVLPIYRERFPEDQRLVHGLRVTRAWTRGQATLEELRDARTDVSLAQHDARQRASDEFDAAYPEGAASFPLPWEAAATVARAAWYALNSSDDIACALSAAQQACDAVRAAGPKDDFDIGPAERQWQHDRLPEPARRLRWLAERLY
jgi:hypothetical protein